jgi:hypothetical protein
LEANKARNFMQRPLLGGRRGVAAAVRSIAITVVMLLPGLPTPCSAQASETRGSAWDRYPQASEALGDCRMRGRTLAEKAALVAAEARYRAELGATHATGR